MWPISAQTNLAHSLFISFISAFNHLPWVLVLSDILVSINAISELKFKCRNLELSLPGCQPIQFLLIFYFIYTKKIQSVHHRCLSGIIGFAPDSFTRVGYVNHTQVVQDLFKKL